MNLLVLGLALAIAIGVALLPRAALGATFDTSRPAPVGPRWSNDHHLEDGLIVTPDCVVLPPDMAAPYMPGRDAWGRPVPPADTTTGPGYSVVPPVELEVDLGTKKLGGQDIDLHLPPVTYDPGNNSLNGHPLSRDCTPFVK